MKNAKLQIRVEDLGVDSFATSAKSAPATLITTKPYTCPECANTVYLTCDC